MNKVRWIAAFAVTIVVILAGCGSDPITDSSQPTTSGPVAATDGAESTRPERFDVPDDFDFSRQACIDHFGHPCLRSEYDPEVAQLQATYAEALSDLIASGSREEAYEWISRQESVIESHFSDNRVMFQVAGAMPFSIITPIPEPPPVSGEAENAVNATAAVGVPAGAVNAAPAVHPLPAAPSFFPAGVVGEGTERANPQNKKQALFLEPWASTEGSLLNAGASRARVREVFAKIHDYSHPNALVHVVDDNAAPDWFTSEIWRQYDFIYVSTHGDTSSTDVVLESGVRQLWSSTMDEAAACDALMAPYFFLHGLECGYQQPSGTNGPTYLTLDMTEIFFFNQYYGPGRQLEKAVVYIEACRSLQSTVLAATIAGSSSAYFGWSDYINLTKARELSGELILQLTNRYRTTGVSLKTLCTSFRCGGWRYKDPASQNDPFLKLHKNGAEPANLRLYDLPTPRQPTSPTNVLEDGDKLKIRGTAGDGENDQLELTVDVIGVIDPADTNDDIPEPGVPGLNSSYLEAPADRYGVRFFIDDEDIGIDNLGNAIHPEANVIKVGDGNYRYTYVADLPFDVDPEGTDVTLRVVVVDVKEEWTSDYEVDITLVPIDTGATVTVGGQTWEFELAEIMGGCMVGPTGVVTGGSVDGDPNRAMLSAQFNRDGSGEVTVFDPDAFEQWMAANDRAQMTVLHLVPDGQSQIDQVTFEGHRIFGFATFIETKAFINAWSNKLTYPNPVGGTFEVRCPVPVDGE